MAVAAAAIAVTFAAMAAAALAARTLLQNLYTKFLIEHLIY